MALGGPLDSTGRAVKNPDTFISVIFGDWETFDPAWADDDASAGVILQVYEPLIFFDGARMDRFVPMLATAVPTVQNGLLSPDGKTYTFPIRQGVQFHDGTPLSAEDAAYSLRRFLLTDRDAGPSALLLEPILGVPSTRDNRGNLTLRFADLQRAIQVRGNTLVVTLKEPFGPFISIMAQWSWVVSKQWAIAGGEWNGTAATMAKHNNIRKETSAFFERANGTGPFKLETWDRAGRQTIIVRNEHYWRKPARLARVVFRGIDGAATRIRMLKAGDADAIALGRSELPQVEGQPGIWVIDSLPQPRTDGFFFTVDIDTRGNPHVGSGRLDGNGIPGNFFSDVHLRRAFAHAFDYGTYIALTFRGRASTVTGMIPPGMPGYSFQQPYFTFNREKAIAEFKEAFGGRVWERGFKLTALHNVPHPARALAARVLKDSVESLNPKFKVDVKGLTWSSYLAGMDQHKLPIFFAAWVAEYPDGHTFAFHFAHSEGTYPDVQKFKNGELDRLIMRAVRESDWKKREAIYFRIGRKYFELVPSVATHSPVTFRVQRSWAQGWYHNPVFPETYYYTVFKG